MLIRFFGGDQIAASTSGGKRFLWLMQIKITDVEMNGKLRQSVNIGLLNSCFYFKEYVNENRKWKEGKQIETARRKADNRRRVSSFS